MYRIRTKKYDVVFEIEDGSVRTEDPEFQTIVDTLNNWFRSKRLDGKTVQGQSYYTANQRLWYFIQEKQESWDWEVLEDTEVEMDGHIGENAVN